MKSDEMINVFKGPIEDAGSKMYGLYPWQGFFNPILVWISDEGDVEIDFANQSEYYVLYKLATVEFNEDNYSLRTSDSGTDLTQENADFIRVKNKLEDLINKMEPMSHIDYDAMINRNLQTIEMQNEKKIEDDLVESLNEIGNTLEHISNVLNQKSHEPQPKPVTIGQRIKSIFAKLKGVRYIRWDV